MLLVDLDSDVIKDGTRRSIHHSSLDMGSCSVGIRYFCTVLLTVCPMMSLLVSQYQLTGGVLLPPNPDPGVCGVDQQHPHHHRPAAAAQARLHPL